MRRRLVQASVTNAPASLIGRREARRAALPADAREIDEAALHIDPDELDADAIADIEIPGSAHDLALDRGVHDAGPRPLG